VKIAVRKFGSVGVTYGPKYDQDFFDSLWKDVLLSKLDLDDEIVWVEHMPVNGSDFDAMLSDFDAVIGAFIKPGMITGEILNNHPNLKYIGTISHGYSAFDKEACRANGVTVTNTIFNDASVAQHTFALLLEICNNVWINNNFYKIDKWKHNNPTLNKLYTRQTELAGKTMGIVGLGNVGVKTARIAHGFGMQVTACSRSEKRGQLYNGIYQTTLKEVLRNSDIISIHCSLNESTKNLIDRAAINSMKNDVIIINTSRGEIIDEDALDDALLHRKVYAAGLDVLANEPLKEPNNLINNPYTITTEHIAWASIDSRIRSIVVGCENFFNWRNGRPTSVISEE